LPKNLLKRELMFKQLKQRWNYLKASEPGHRFQERYFRLQQNRRERPYLNKLVTIVGGLFIILIGIIFLFIPGSGWVIIFIGAAVIAGESRFLARFLDWLEVRLRRVVKWLRTRSQKPARSSVGEE